MAFHTVNRKIACIPIELKKNLLTGSLSSITDRTMLELEVAIDSEDFKYKKGDKIYLSRDLENNDSAIWLKSVCVLRNIPCVLIPEEFILACFSEKI